MCWFSVIGTIGVCVIFIGLLCSSLATVGVGFLLTLICAIADSNGLC